MKCVPEDKHLAVSQHKLTVVSNIHNVIWRHQDVVREQKSERLECRGAEVNLYQETVLHKLLYQQLSYIRTR